MKLKYLILMILLAFSTQVLADFQIEKGDKLRIYIIDSKGTDVVMGTFVQEKTIISGDYDLHDFLVSLEGKIYIPNVGALKVEGKSSSELEKMIYEKLAGRRALQEVTVLSISPKYKVIYVTGEVEKPGMFKIDMTKPTEGKLLNIISNAGGFTNRADKENLSIINENGVITTINISDMVKNKSTKENIELSDKDTIIVPQALNRVYVLGEVTTPGGYQFISSASFLDYLAEAGGAKNSAEIANIGIVRKTVDKNIIYKVSLNNNLMVNSEKTQTIQPGDIIYVAKSWFADWKDIGYFIGMLRDTNTVYDYWSKP